MCKILDRVGGIAENARPKLCTMGIVTYARRGANRQPTAARSCRNAEAGGSGEFKLSSLQQDLPV